MRLHTQIDKPSGIGFRCQRNPLPKLTAGHSPRQVPSNPQISAGLSSLLSPNSHIATLGLPGPAEPDRPLSSPAPAPVGVPLGREP